MMGLTVYFSDGTQETYQDVISAEEGISETVLGCNFAVAVEDIQSDDDKEFTATWSLNLHSGPSPQNAPWGAKSFGPLLDALKAIAQDEGNGDNFKWAQMIAREAIKGFEDE